MFTSSTGVIVGSWRTALAALALSALISGCGSNFEWFPDDGVFNNNSTVPVPGTAPGTVMLVIPFPASPVSVKAVSDIAYDKNSGSFWLLAVTSALGNSSNAPDALVQMTPAGEVLSTLNANAWPPNTIIDGSTLAYDGNSFWITGSGTIGPGEIYRITRSGSEAMYLNISYNCPATSRGFCQGLAWDNATASFWSAAADSASLVNYQLSSGVVTSLKTYTNLWAGVGVTDVSFDSATGEVFVVKSGVLRVKGSNGARLNKITFPVPGNGRGDWDGQYFWVVDNSAHSLKALFIR